MKFRSGHLFPNLFTRAILLELMLFPEMRWLLAVPGLNKANLLTALIIFGVCMSPSLSVRTNEVLLLTDVHLDLDYDAGLSSLCKCESRYDEDGTCFFSAKSNHFGQFGCDSSLNLLQSTLAAAAAVSDPAFVIYAGDFARHSSPSGTSTFGAIRTVREQISTYFPSATIVANFGNSDMSKDYSLNMTEGVANNPYLSKVADILWAEQGDLEEESRGQFSRTGFYSVEVAPGLTILSLNTIVYSIHHTPNTTGIEDPFGQFEWLEGQLTAIQAAEGACWIIGHIPPVIESSRYQDLWEPRYSRRFLDLLRDYGSAVKTLLFGHTHTDEFRIISTTCKCLDYFLLRCQ